MESTDRNCRQEATHAIAYKAAPLLRSEDEIKRGNRLLMVKQDGAKEEIASFNNLEIKFMGDHSLVEIHESLKIAKKLSISCETGAFIKLEKNIVFTNAKIATAPGTTFYCGEGGDLKNLTVHLNAYPGLEVVIGKNCLFSWGVVMRANDAHTIFSANDPKKILNEPSLGIHIGDNVWIGQNAYITKDTRIPDGCIVGACSVVTQKAYPKNCILAGNPARVIREGVNWSRSSIPAYKDKLNLPRS